jgi:hypothetical protein
MMKSFPQSFAFPGALSLQAAQGAPGPAGRGVGLPIAAGRPVAVAAVSAC